MTVFASAIAAFISSSDEKSNTFSPIYSGSVSSGQMTVASIPCLGAIAAFNDWEINPVGCPAYVFS